jgi:hypothetical protein
MKKEIENRGQSLQKTTGQETKRIAATTERNAGQRAAGVKVKTRMKAGGWMTSGA